MSTTEPSNISTVSFVPLNSGVEAGLALNIAVIGHGAHRNVSVVRTTRIATAYLGAICDAVGNPFAWVELWFPHESLDKSGEGNGEPARVARWNEMMRRWERSPGSGMLKAGWEDGIPRPLVLQLETLSWWSLVDPATGKPLQPCRDDSQLAAANLPLYSANTAVFLSADGNTFYQASGVSVGPHLAGIDALLPAGAPFVALSVTGRCMAVRRLSPLALGDYADILAGTLPSSELERHEVVRLSLDPDSGGLDVECLKNPHRWLLRARAGRTEWLTEIITLKLRLLLQALRQVRDAIAVTQEPFLSLSEHSFAVGFGAAGSPVKLWDFAVALHATGCASICRAGSTRYAWRALSESQMPPAYERRSIGRKVSREVECRLRQVSREDGQLLVEATLGSGDIQSPGGMLARLHLPLAVGRCVLWGRLSRDDSLARHEIRFRSFLTQYESPITAELDRIQGFVWSSVLLDVLPAAGYGDDLHSLGVLAVRLLLTSEARQLPGTLDAVFSVLERLGESSRPGIFGPQVREAFESEPRLRELLHPGRAVAFPISGEDAVASLGGDLWWELLAFVLRLFPSALASSFCQAEAATDLGTFPRVFDEAIHAAESLDRRLTDRVMPVEGLNLRIRAITDEIRRTALK